MSTPREVERELRALVARGVRIDSIAQRDAAARARLRRSAVLILFGALDSTPAVTGGSAPGVAPELDVLLTRRAQGMRHHAGQIAFPGGGTEPADGGDPRRTALREAAEETGLDPAGVDVLGTLPQVPLDVSDNLVTPVVGWWRLPSEVGADHTESVEVFRVPVAELLDPAARGTATITFDRGTFRSPAFLLGEHLGGHIVWGFTGILLATLFDELGWTVPWNRARLFRLR